MLLNSSVVVTSKHFIGFKSLFYIENKLMSIQNLGKENTQIYFIKINKLGIKNYRIQHQFIKESIICIQIFVIYHINYTPSKRVMDNEPIKAQNQTKIEEQTKKEQGQKQNPKAEEAPVNQANQTTQNVIKKQTIDESGSVVNPYDIVNNTGKQIDYNKLLNKFGCFPVNEAVIARIQKLTGKPAHHLIKRGIFYAHRDLDLILNEYQKHQDKSVPPFYLYTGRGPSSEALHLGHMLPFIFNKYLQQAFNVPLVIQISDDQKYFWKEGDLEDFARMGYDNLKDIIALGFDPEKTFIFINSQYMGTMYPNVMRMQKHINLNTLKAIFGLDFSDNCGKTAYPAVQAAPCLSSSFPHIFGKKNLPCLIPCGIDQDPYFRMTRDVCARLKAPKPAGFYSKFFPSLQGFQTKMSASIPTSGIFMTDKPKEIENKIKKNAFSGGRATKQEQQQFGADLSVDIPYHYLVFFLQDDAELKEIAEKYSTGKMLTGEIKKILIKVLQKFVADHQQRRNKVTDEEIKKFLSTHERKFVYN